MTYASVSLPGVESDSDTSTRASMPELLPVTPMMRQRSGPRILSGRSGMFRSFDLLDPDILDAQRWCRENGLQGSIGAGDFWDTNAEPVTMVQAAPEGTMVSARRNRSFFWLFLCPCCRL
uniref:Uncharacterized protein n=1 Tax=Noctiluca scintillans TaxID=2966 RepID=A0A7S1AIU6_NOCSC|mmetsp:Transcript_48171/g.127561  ORF Transcript_48171/g.127561 Transcript_48171/m.127561 type:complete len:120 (+) Transcript_48171:51-410(+)